MGNDPVNFTDPSGLDPHEVGHSILGYSEVRDSYDPWVDDEANRQFMEHSREFNRALVMPMMPPVIETGGGVGLLLPPPQAEPRAPLTGDDLTRYRSERERLVQLLRDRNSDCAKFLRERLGLSGSRLARAVLGQRAFDGTRSTINAGDAGLVPRGYTADFPNHDIQVRDYFAVDRPNAAQAAHARGSTGASFRDVYYSPPGLNASTILHETLHSFLGLNDSQLQGRLGLGAGPASNITDALRNAGCR